MNNVTTNEFVEISNDNLFQIDGGSVIIRPIIPVPIAPLVPWIAKLIAKAVL